MTVSKPGLSLIARIRAVEPAPPWNLTSALIAMVVAILAFIGGTFAAEIWLSGQPTALIAGWVIGGIITIIFVLQSRKTPEQRAALKLHPGGTPLLFIIFISFGLALTIDLLSLLVTGQFLPAPVLLSAAVERDNTALLVISAVFLLLVQPIAEELVFRGIVFPVLRIGFGAWPGLIAASAASGIFHLLIYPAAYAMVFPDATSFATLWHSGVNPLLAALIFGIVRAVTGSTRSAIAAHFAFGLFALFKLLIGF